MHTQTAPAIAGANVTAEAKTGSASNHTIPNAVANRLEDAIAEACATLTMLKNELCSPHSRRKKAECQKFESWWKETASALNAAFAEAAPLLRRASQPPKNEVEESEKEKAERLLTRDGISQGALMMLAGHYDTIASKTFDEAAFLFGCYAELIKGNPALEKERQAMLAIDDARALLNDLSLASVRV